VLAAHLACQGETRWPLALVAKARTNERSVVVSCALDAVRATGVTGVARRALSQITRAALGCADLVEMPESGFLFQRRRFRVPSSTRKPFGAHLARLAASFLKNALNKGLTLTTNSARKFASLQILRALAAWTVVFHHYMQMYFDFKSDSMIGAFFAQYGAIGVDVFFVISGFVMYLVAAKSDTGPLAFVIDRIFRIAPIYWFYSILTVACIYLFQDSFAYTSFNLKSLLASAFFLPSWNPSGIGVFPVLTVGWSLNFEMFFYLALTCCMAASARHFFKLVFFLLLISPILYPSDLYFSHVAGSFKLYEFLAGALLAIAWTSRGGSAWIQRYRYPALAAAFGATLVGMKILNSFESTLPVALPFALALVMFALLCEPHLRMGSPLVRRLVKLGDESYSTYLLHSIALGVVIHFTGRHLAPIAQLSVLLGMTGTVLALSSLSYRWLERNTYIDRLRQTLIKRYATRTSNASKNGAAQHKLPSAAMRTRPDEAARRD
jgi:exopolysaccharide production protein ExoZ